jgi:hypothetical protein
LQTECRRIVRSHYGAYRIGLVETRAEILNCARKAEKGSACDLAEELQHRLEVATQLTIKELAENAKGWTL